MCSSTGSSSLRASSGSRSASSSIEPLRSAKSTVTCLRSPSSARLGGEDLLGEVLGRVGLRRGNLPRRRGSRERPTALAAELLRAGVRGATGRAHRRQPRSALPTELHGGEVVVLAPRAVHAGSPPTRDVGPVSDQRRCAPTLPGALLQVKDRRWGRGGRAMACADRSRQFRLARRRVATEKVSRASLPSAPHAGWRPRSLTRAPHGSARL